MNEQDRPEWVVQENVNGKSPTSGPVSQKCDEGRKEGDTDGHGESGDMHGGQFTPLSGAGSRAMVCWTVPFSQRGKPRCWIGALTAVRAVSAVPQ